MRIQPFTLSGRHVSLVPLGRSHVPALHAAADRERSTYGHTVVPADLAAMEAYIDGLLQDAEREDRKSTRLNSSHQ